MSDKTIDEYFSERMLKLGRSIYIDGIEHIVIRTDGGHVGLVDMVSFMLVTTSRTSISTPAGYVGKNEIDALVSPEDCVHIGVGHPDNCESMSADKYFGERKMPIGTLAILDGVEHRLTRAVRGDTCSLVSTDTWAETRSMTNVPSSYTNGLTRRQFQLLSNPYTSIAIGDTDEQ